MSRTPHLRESRLRLPPGMAVGLAVALSACTANRELAAQHDKDLAALRAELASQRLANDALTARLERLEARAAAPVAAPVASKPATTAPQIASRYADLPTVRLERPAPRAPPLDTRIAIVEPSDEDLAALDRPSKAVNLDATLERNDEKAEAVFATAVREYNAGNRREAGLALAAFAEKYPQHDAADNALYLAGMAQMADGRCQNAIRFFNQVVDGSPEADAAGPSLLALAQCEATLGHASTAQSLFERVLKEYPRSPEASQAEAGLTDLPKAPQAAPVARQ